MVRGVTGGGVKGSGKYRGGTNHNKIKLIQEETSTKKERKNKNNK